MDGKIAANTFSRLLKQTMAMKSHANQLRHQNSHRTPQSDLIEARPEHSPTRETI